MKTRILPLLALQTLLIFVLSGFAKQKVLFVVHEDAYAQLSGQIDAYKSDVEMLDNKKVEIIEWPLSYGTNVEMCIPLILRLQSEYVEARSNGDVLEGAVMMGDVPVPQYDGGYGKMPLDQVYMDLVDTAGNPYTGWPYTPFFPTGPYFGNTYDSPPGDGAYEIWVSRINAVFLSDLREGMSIYDEFSIYSRYLNRLSDRMNYPSTVPSRGFFMGGPQDHDHDIYSTFGQYLNELHLPWLAQFTGGHNTSFNWMSQLLAGPRGCINYGAFNGTLFPTTGRNSRFCRYTQLPAVYEYGDTTPTAITISTTDSLGWEWAGLYNHSCPVHTNFFSNDGVLGNNPPQPHLYIKLNGEFEFGTVGRPLDSTYRRTASGYGGSYYCYQDSASDPNPYQYGRGWKNKGAEWRWIVPPGDSGNYNIYLYYEAPDSTARDTNNCDTVGISLRVADLDASGVPQSISTGYNENISQQTHINYLPADHKWERLFGATVFLGEGQMAIIGLQLNDEWGLRPGNRIVDAVRFIRASGGIDTIIDDAQPGTFPDSVNNPGTIFSSTGFHLSDDVFRGFEDLGSEPGGGGFSKSQFFLTNACSINDFTYSRATEKDKNIGNLYALGYNGLICMGATTNDYGGDDKGPYTRALRNGNCFGQAYLDKINAFFSTSYLFTLLGAGTLRAQPYIQYGSEVIRRRVISDTQSVSTNNPVLIGDVTVNGNGDWHVTTTHDGSSPFGTHPEIVIRPETVISPTGSNEVVFTAN